MSQTKVFMIDPKITQKLHDDLTDKGFTFTKPPYTHFQAKKDTVVVTAYTSGKLTIAGKGSKEFIEFYVEPELLGNFSHSIKALEEDTKAQELIQEPHMGSDEAGKGDYFGPLCICAFYGDQETVKALQKLKIKESKLLNDETILKLLPELRKFPHELMVLTPKTYNSLYDKFGNLNRMLSWCHAKVLGTLSSRVHCQRALIDQFAPKETIAPFIKSPLLLDLVDVRVRAESDPIVAAASLIARGAFLQTLRDLSKEFDMQLPKGATHVKEALSLFINRWGRDNLTNVAKLHFKTTKEI